MDNFLEKQNCDAHLIGDALVMLEQSLSMQYEITLYCLYLQKGKLKMICCKIQVNRHNYYNYAITIADSSLS